MTEEKFRQVLIDAIETNQKAIQALTKKVIKLENDIKIIIEDMNFSTIIKNVKKHKSIFGDWE